jgi:hypothetical protein
MAKKEKYNKKNLKKRLLAIVTIYLDGLGEKKKKKMDKYLGAKLGDVVEYYAGILSKRKWKRAVLPPVPQSQSKLDPVFQEVNNEPVIAKTLEIVGESNLIIAEAPVENQSEWKSDSLFNFDKSESVGALIITENHSQ